PTSSSPTRCPSTTLFRSPVIHQAQAENVRFGFIDRDRLAERVAGAYKETGFEFVIERLAWTIRWPLLAGILPLTLRPANRRPAKDRKSTRLNSSHRTDLV